MLANVLITAFCIFVILRKTAKPWIAAAAYTGIYFVLWLIFTRQFLSAFLLQTVIYFAYSFIFFFIINKFDFEENQVAFVITFVAGTLFHTFFL